MPRSWPRRNPKGNLKESMGPRQHPQHWACFSPGRQTSSPAAIGFSLVFSLVPAKPRRRWCQKELLIKKAGCKCRLLSLPQMSNTSTCMFNDPSDLTHLWPTTPTKPADGHDLVTPTKTPASGRFALQAVDCHITSLLVKTFEDWSSPTNKKVAAAENNRYSSHGPPFGWWSRLHWWLQGQWQRQSWRKGSGEGTCYPFQCQLFCQLLHPTSWHSSLLHRKSFPIGAWTQQLLCLAYDLLTCLSDLWHIWSKCFLCNTYLFYCQRKLLDNIHLCPCAEQ